jgi:hypothetical protein
MANQTFEPFLVVKSYPFYLHPYPLHLILNTFCHHFVYIIDKFQPKNYVVANIEVNPHAVNTPLFYLKFSDCLRVMIFKV